MLYLDPSEYKYKGLIRLGVLGVGCCSHVLREGYSHCLAQINFIPPFSILSVYLLKTLIMSAKYTRTWNSTPVARASQENWG